MCQPEGFDDRTGCVCLLIKTLYGLKQSGREWNIEFVTTAMATLLSRDSELLVAQVESCRDEQESVEATPRGVHIRVNTLKGP